MHVLCGKAAAAKFPNKTPSLQFFTKKRRELAFSASLCDVCIPARKAEKGRGTTADGPRRYTQGALHFTPPVPLRTCIAMLSNVSKSADVLRGATEYQDLWADVQTTRRCGEGRARV